MEGFFDIKLTIWKRVLVTRSIAIMPALVVAFLQDFDDVDNYLNILQSIQLPFALIPLLKFTSSDLVMGRFANGKFAKWFSIVMAIGLFIVNAVGLVPIGGKLIIIIHTTSLQLRLIKLQYFKLSHIYKGSLIILLNSWWLGLCTRGNRTADLRDVDNNSFESSSVSSYLA